MTPRLPVLIVGAGPTGLVLALWLTRIGVRARIIDKTAEPCTTSRALAVQSRTLEYYRQFGVADKFIEDGVKVESINLWVQGNRAARLPFQAIGQGLSPYPFPLILPQDLHERLLIKQLGESGVAIERQTELISFRESVNGVHAILRRAGAPDELCKCESLAGCDGAHSTVRSTLGVGFPGGTYSAVFYVADVEATGPASDRQLHVDLDHADFLIVFPLKEKGRVRLVGTIRKDLEAVDRSLTFEDVKDRAIAQLDLTISNVNWFSTYQVHHRVASRFRVGRTFLLGDAAHVHSPVGGQGMNTGIGDAVNLAWKLAAVLNRNASRQLLDSYEPERRAFALRLVDTTDRVFTIVTSRGRWAEIVRTRIVPLVAPLAFRFPAVRRLLFRTVSQIGVHYRDSPLSGGVGGTIRGGDRLPWFELAAEKDNFGPLASLGWQVHVYGETTHQLNAICEEIGVPLRVFPWTAEMRRAGFSPAAFYLVRPDGYVALAGSLARLRRLKKYFGLIGVTPRPPA